MGGPAGFQPSPMPGFGPGPMAFGRPQAPGGNWRQTARNIEVFESFGRFTVSAELQNSMGFWNTATTEFLPGDHFKNDDGNFLILVHSRGNGRCGFNDQPREPKGSWRQSVKPGSIRMHRAHNGDGWVLHAELQD